MFPKSSKILLTSRNSGDISLFNTYPDSDKVCPSVKKADDPFLDWFN